MFGCELKSCTKLNYTKDYFNNNHTHPYYELVYYYEGEGRVSVMDKVYAFEKNTFAISMPEHYHNERGGKGVQLIYISFTLNGFTLEDGLHRDEDGRIGKLVAECYEELEGRRPVFQLILNNIAEKIVLSVIRKELKDEEQRDNDFGYILNYVDMSYNLNLSVKQIAKNIGYSYDYFRDLFFRHMNISAKDYLLDKKIEHAKSLLISTDYRLPQIASLSGFSSASHLCMVFRKKTGMTPQQFTRAHEEDDYNSPPQYYLPTEKTKSPFFTIK